jgi:antitoxin (DNA-binding transcriptional repressor) of toxin-antitoxin stability system
MKKITATEARRRWFRVLDEAAAGEVIVVERHGARIVVRREDAGGTGRAGHRDYRSLVGGRVDDADRWGWEWRGPGRPLRPLTRRR